MSCVIRYRIKTEAKDDFNKYYYVMEISVAVFYYLVKNENSMIVIYVVIYLCIHNFDLMKTQVQNR